MSTLEQIEAHLDRLPRKLQVQLTERLNARLWPSGFSSAVENVWSETVKRRTTEMDTGKVAGVPAARVLARSRRLLARQ